MHESPFLTEEENKQGIVISNLNHILPIELTSQWTTLFISIIGSL